MKLVPIRFIDVFMIVRDLKTDRYLIGRADI